MIKRGKKIVYINENADFEDDFIDEDEEFLNEADENNSGTNNDPEPPMDEEKLRIESLKLATSVAKLMDNVTPEDIITIAGMLAEFIRNNKNGDIDANDDTFNTESNDFEDELPADFDEESEDNNEE